MLKKMLIRIAQALILNVLQSRLISTLYECIKMNLHLFKMLDVKVYFGRCPNHVPKGAIVFFPCHMNRLSCGFTGIVAFSRQESPPAGIDLTPLTAELTKIRQNGFSACSDMSADDFTERYLGGDEPVTRLFEAIRALKQNHSYYRIYKDPALFNELKDLGSHIKSVITIETRHLNDQMGTVSARQFDAMSLRIEKLKDAAWCIETEILANIGPVKALAGNAKNRLSVESISAARQINAVLNSIDRLEVRGRDSAGISLIFVLDDVEYTALIDDLSSADLYERFAERSNKDVLTNAAVTVNRGNGYTAVAMTYKVAAEIGALGDNIRFIRNQIKTDPVFAAIISRPRLFFTVSAHTRWASVGAITEPNCHPVDNRTMTTTIGGTGIIHVCLNGDIDNYQDIKSAHEKRGTRFFEDITCDTKIIPVHVEYYYSQGHDMETAFRLAVNDFEGSHAITMHTDITPGKFFLALKGSGQAIFIGLASDHYIPTSEVYGFVEETSRFLKMDGEAVNTSPDGRNVSGQICIIDQSGQGGTGGIKAMFYCGAPIALSEEDIRTTQLVSRDIDRQDFNHYFLKEISEAPASARKTLANRWKIVEGKDGPCYEIFLDHTCVPDSIRSDLAGNRIRRIVFIGQGTAGVAALVCANQMHHYLKEGHIRVEAMNFLKEISEAPASARKTLANRWKIVEGKDGPCYEIFLDHTCVPDSIRSDLAGNHIRRIVFIGQGTAGVAALVCANQMHHYLKERHIRVEAMKSSELSGFMVHDGQSGAMDDTLLVPISQSGTTTDTNRAVDMVRRKGGRIICIVNRRDSDLTFKSDGVIYTSSGRDIEMSVASTKAFYSQIIAGAIFGLFVAGLTEKPGSRFISNEINEMIRIPDLMEKTLSMTDKIRASAHRLALQRTYWAVVGSGPNKAAADEIRIKLSELCYKTISSDYVEDKKHIDLSSEPLIIICAAGTRRSVLGDIVKDTAIFKSHKALPVVICDDHEDRFDPYAEDVFHVPPVSEHFAPVLNTLVGHIWGYYAALTINEGSKFLFDFKEELETLIRTYTQSELDIFDIVLEDGFREKILAFYRDFRNMQHENRLPGTIGIHRATNLVLLLKYLSGRLPVNDFEFDFGIKGTAKNMFALFFEAMGESINVMARPVDAIKHQAKTVTVGTSRIEEKAEGRLFEALSENGFGIEHLALTNVMVIRNIQKIIARINGSTLYRVSGVNLLGEPTDKTTITVVAKTGTSASLPSRTESDQSLKGSKRIIVRQGNVYLGKGRKDDRSVLVIPVLSADPSHPNMVEHLLLLEVEFRNDVDLPIRVKALGGKHEHIKNIVQENSITWQDEYLDRVPMEELFGRSAEKVAEMIVEKVR